MAATTTVPSLPSKISMATCFPPTLPTHRLMIHHCRRHPQTCVCKVNSIRSLLMQSWPTHWQPNADDASIEAHLAAVHIHIGFFSPVSSRSRYLAVNFFFATSHQVNGLLCWREKDALLHSLPLGYRVSTQKQCVCVCVRWTWIALHFRRAFSWPVHCCRCGATSSLCMMMDSFSLYRTNTL